MIENAGYPPFSSRASALGRFPLLPPGRLVSAAPSLLPDSFKPTTGRFFGSVLPKPLELFKRFSAGDKEFMVVDGLPVTIDWSGQTRGGPRLPEGYGTLRGSLPKGLSKVATHILKRGNPIGTYTPFTLNGKSYVALNEYHTHYASRPHAPPGRIYAITVFRKL